MKSSRKKGLENEKKHNLYIQKIWKSAYFMEREKEVETFSQFCRFHNFVCKSCHLKSNNRGKLFPFPPYSYLLKVSVYSYKRQKLDPDPPSWASIFGNSCYKYRPFVTSTLKMRSKTPYFTIFLSVFLMPTETAPQIGLSAMPMNPYSMYGKLCEVVAILV